MQENLAVSAAATQGLLNSKVPRSENIDNILVLRSRSTVQTVVPIFPPLRRTRQWIVEPSSELTLESVGATFVLAQPRMFDARINNHNE